MDRVLSPRDEEDRQRKMEAWMRVAKLMEEAYAVLVAVEVTSWHVPALERLEESARAQVNLWT